MENQVERYKLVEEAAEKAINIIIDSCENIGNRKCDWKGEEFTILFSDYGGAGIIWIKRNNFFFEITIGNHQVNCKRGEHLDYIVFGNGENYDAIVYSPNGRKHFVNRMINSVKDIGQGECNVVAETILKTAIVEIDENIPQEKSQTIIQSICNSYDSSVVAANSNRV